MGWAVRRLAPLLFVLALALAWALEDLIWRVYG